ncbi:MAG: hypothetical protein ABI414_06705, partial [Devosia sp.]
MKLAIAAAALLLNCGAALAGDYALLSMHYSADQFVPHIRFDGVIASGDAAGLGALFERTLGCEQTCPGPSAVLTLNSVGGNYLEAQAIADLLRTHHVATVIETDQSCYGACVVAFTGGSALTASGTIAPDRTVVPGAKVVLNNFAEPHQALAPAILAQGIDSVLGGTPAELEALASAGNWGLSPMVDPYLSGMMSSALNLANPEGLYFMSARLPAIARADIEPAQAVAVLNACSYVIAHHERQTPIDMIEQPDPGFIESFDPSGGGAPLMGYQVSDMDDFSFCGTRATNVAFDTIALYSVDDKGLHKVDALTVQSHMLLDPWMPLADIEAIFTPVVAAARFESAAKVFLTQGGEAMLDNPLGVKTLYQDKYRRISSFGDLMIYEQAGDAGLFDAAVAHMKSPAIIRPQLNEMPSITTLQGTYADSGNGVAMMAFDDMNDAVVRIELGKPWDDLTADEWSFVAQFECGVVIGNLNLE